MTGIRIVRDRSSEEFQKKMNEEVAALEKLGHTIKEIQFQHGFSTCYGINSMGDETDIAASSYAAMILVDVLIKPQV